MKIQTIAILVLSLAFFACKSDVKEGSMVEEVPSKIKINSELPERPKPRQPIEDATPIDSINVAAFAFEEEFFDFGDVKQGDVLRHTFKFKNIGKVPLVITSAKSTCGCTVPEYSKKPVAVGETGELSVKFNTKGKQGVNNKPINIIANTYPKLTKLGIRAAVAVPKKEKEEQ